MVLAGLAIGLSKRCLPRPPFEKVCKGPSFEHLGLPTLWELLT